MINVPPLMPIVPAWARTASVIIRPARRIAARRVPPDERAGFNIPVVLLFKFVS